MAQAAENREPVVSLVEYLRETLKKLDAIYERGYEEWVGRRSEVADRLAVLEAATDPDLHAASAEARRRIENGEQYPNARDANDVITEAHRRFVTT